MLSAMDAADREMVVAGIILGVVSVALGAVAWLLLT